MNKLENYINWGATLFIPVLLFLLAPFWDSLFEEKKAIEYSIVGEREIFNKEDYEENWPRLKFNMEDSELKNAILTVIKVVNSGKVPIKGDDFESPIRFDLEFGGGMMMPRVAASHPMDLPVDISVDDNSLLISPLLLNTGDYFYIEILTESKVSIKKVTARIVGIDVLKEKELESYAGLMIELIEPGKTVSSSSHNPLMPVSGYMLIVTSLLTAFCSLIFFFVYYYAPGVLFKALFFLLAINMYTIYLASSKFMPYAFWGFGAEKWMEYVSMLGCLLFGAAFAFLVRNKLSILRLKLDSSGI